MESSDSSSINVGGSGSTRNQQSPQRYACHCGKSFIRKEHLRRHQASHAEPAFTCSVCKRSFTRSDLLRRHVALHDASAVPEFRRGRACDACHANKTKCDGGEQCTLCAKRGISCTYTRGATTAPASESSASSAQGHPVEALPQEMPPVSSASSATGDFSEGGRSGPSELLPGLPPSILPPTGSPVQGLDPALGLGSQDMGSSLNHDAFGNMVTDPEKEASLRTANAGLNIVLKQVMASRVGQQHSPSRPTTTPEVAAWLTSRIDACFGTFHDRWPLVHGPTFEPAGRPACLIATMAIIGSWLNDDKSTRNLSVEIHNNLVQQLLEDILRIDLDPKARWPMETYVCALYNVIFALETGRDYLIPKARLLQSLLHTAIRGQGILNSDALAHQNAKYYPGDYGPWVHTTHERWKRLVINIFKVDAYLSLLTNDAPTLRLEELGLGQISTPAMWNAYGLDVFFRRWPCEPHDRTRYKLSDNTAATLRNSAPSVVLVEDIQHCMLGMIPDIWTLSYARQNYGEIGPGHMPMKDMILDQLQLCKDHINRIVGLLANTGIQTQQGEALLGAYSCKEEPGHPKWKDNVKARIVSHLHIAATIYHLLSIHVLADMQALRAMFNQTAEPAIPQTPLEQQKHALVQAWSSSSEGRLAVAHAVSCLAVYRRAVRAEMARGGTVDPILHTALLSSAGVAWAWMTHSRQVCRCSEPTQQVDLDTEDLFIEQRGEVENWVVSEMPLALSSTSLCSCSRDTWMSHYMSAFDAGAQSWEMSSVAINALGAKLGRARGV